MRKILLGTTGVVGAALIGMGAAQAQQAPTVRVGGYLQTTFTWIDDDLDKSDGAPRGVAQAGAQGRSKADFRNEVEIHVFVTGKAANGLSYGAVVEIQNDNVGGGSGSALDLDEAYVFVSTPALGTIRFGEEDSAASIMQVRAPTITGFGADGAWDVAILNTGFNGGNPSLFTGINDGSDSTKIIYLSPQFFGFDFGVSYAPNAGEGDRPFYGRNVDATAIAGVNNTQRDRTNLENEVAYALRYRGSFGGVGIAAGFGGMFADSPRVTGAGADLRTTAAGRAQQVNAYTFGLNLTAFGLTVGGEYTFGQYSGASVGRGALARGSDDSEHYLLGATYVMGAFSVGGYYGVAEQDNGRTLTFGTGAGATTLGNPADRKQTTYGVGVAYTVAPGLEVFANYNYIKDENAFIRVGTATRAATLQDREISSFFLGTRLAF